jgi:hypothetical protein
VELDYRELHPRMLYAQEGQRCPDDPYDVGLPEVPRAIIKQAFNALLNSKKDLRAKPGDLNLSACPRKWSEIRTTVLQKHLAIRHRLGSGAGLQLQFADSRMALEICAHFAEQGIPILPVHDSFVIARSHADELATVMLEVAYRHLGIELELRREQRWGTPGEEAVERFRRVYAAMSEPAPDRVREEIEAEIEIGTMEGLEAAIAAEQELVDDDVLVGVPRLRAGHLPAGVLLPR